jgi:anti-anti-sigma factor
MPEPHILLSVVAGTPSPSPAAKPACRAGAWPCPGGQDAAHQHLVDSRRSRDGLKGDLLEPAEPGATLVLLDLSEVEFLDSSGLGAVVAARKLLGKQSSACALAGLQPAVEKVLRLTHMDGSFQSMPRPTPSSDVCGGDGA